MEDSLQINNWVLFDTAHGGISELTQTLTGLSREDKVIAYDVLMAELGLLSKQQCLACSGYGHQLRHCPTHRKISRLGNGGTVMRFLVARARAKAASVSNRSINIDHQWSGLR